MEWKVMSCKSKIHGPMVDLIVEFIGKPVPKFEKWKKQASIQQEFARMNCNNTNIRGETTFLWSCCFGGNKCHGVLKILHGLHGWVELFIFGLVLDFQMKKQSWMNLAVRQHMDVNEIQSIFHRGLQWNWVGTLFFHLSSHELQYLAKLKPDRRLCNFMTLVMTEVIFMTLVMKYHEIADERPKFSSSSPVLTFCPVPPLHT